jgi:hypothetical protein
MHDYLAGGAGLVMFLMNKRRSSQVILLFYNKNEVVF